MTSIEQLTQELQRMRTELEFERDQVRRLRDELAGLQRKGSAGGLMGGPQLAPLTSVPGSLSFDSPLARPAAAPLAAAPTGLDPLGGAVADSGMGGFDSGSDVDLEQVKHQLDELTREKHEVEQRKWTIDKENIALKEALNKLKVQGQNNQKIIEELVEKSDRKENQNFKTRLELTDLRKTLQMGKSEREKQEEANSKLHVECLEIEAEIMHYRAMVDLETQRRDIIQAELNRQQDILGQYQGGFLARFYDK